MRFRFLGALGCLLAFCGCEERQWLTLLHPKLRTVDEERQAARKKLDALSTPTTGQTTPHFGYMHPEVPGQNEPRWVQVDLGEVVTIEQIALIPAQSNSDSLQTSATFFPKRFRVEISPDADFKTPATVFDAADAEYPDPGIAPAVFDVPQIKARFVRVTVFSSPAFTLAELMVISGNRDVALGRPVTASGSGEVLPRWARENLVDGRSPLGPPIARELLPYDGLYAGPTSDGSPVWMGVDLRRDIPIEEIRIHPVQARLNNDMPGFGFPLRFCVEAAGQADFSDAKALLDFRETDFPNPGNNSVTVRAENVSARYVRVRLITGGAFIHPQRFGLSELEVYSGGKNAARQAEVISAEDTAPKTRGWPKSILNDGYTSFGRILELPDWLREWRTRHALQTSIAQLEVQHGRLLEEAVRRAFALTGALVTAAAAAIIGTYFFFRTRQRRQLQNFRKGLAQDLHDEVGSNLAAIGIISEGACLQPQRPTPEHWQRVKQIAHETTDAMREILWLAGSREEMRIELMKQMETAAARMLPRREVQWTSKVDHFPEAWPMEARRQVFLLFKESLANIVRHSGAKRVTLSAQLDEDWFELDIQDDGRGFSPDAPRRGLGLESLRDRARKLGGTVTIETAPGKGTHITLRVRVPKER